MCFVHFIFVIFFLLFVDCRNDLFSALLFSSCVCGLFQSTSWSCCNWFVCHVGHKQRQCFLCCFMLPRILEMGMEALCFWVVCPSVRTCVWLESFSDHTHPFNGPFSGTTQVTPPLCFYRPDALPATQPTASKHWRCIKRWRCKKERKLTTPPCSQFLVSLQNVFALWLCPLSCLNFAYCMHEETHCLLQGAGVVETVSAESPAVSERRPVSATWRWLSLWHHRRMGQSVQQLSETVWLHERSQRMEHWGDAWQMFFTAYVVTRHC